MFKTSMDEKYSHTQQFPLAEDNPLRMDLDLDFEKQGSTYSRRCSVHVIMTLDVRVVDT